MTSIVGFNILRCEDRVHVILNEGGRNSRVSMKCVEMWRNFIQRTNHKRFERVFCHEHKAPLLLYRIYCLPV